VGLLGRKEREFRFRKRRGQADIDRKKDLKGNHLSWETRKEKGYIRLWVQNGDARCLLARQAERIGGRNRAGPHKGEEGKELMEALLAVPIQRKSHWTPSVYRAGKIPIPTMEKEKEKAEWTFRGTTRGRSDPLFDQERKGVFGKITKRPCSHR